MASKVGVSILAGLGAGMKVGAKGWYDEYEHQLSEEEADAAMLRAKHLKSYEHGLMKERLDYSHTLKNQELERMDAMKRDWQREQWTHEDARKKAEAKTKYVNEMGIQITAEQYDALSVEQRKGLKTTIDVAAEAAMAATKSQIETENFAKSYNYRLTAERAYDAAYAKAKSSGQEFPLDKEDWIVDFMWSKTAAEGVKPLTASERIEILKLGNASLKDIKENREDDYSLMVKAAGSPEKADQAYLAGFVRDGASAIKGPSTGIGASLLSSAAGAVKDGATSGRLPGATSGIRKGRNDILSLIKSDREAAVRKYMIDKNVDYEEANTAIKKIENSVNRERDYIPTFS